MKQTRKQRKFLSQQRITSKFQRKIYTLVVFCLNDAADSTMVREDSRGREYRVEQRVWGWDDNFARIEKSFLNSSPECFMEHLYNWACIEEVEGGLWARTKVKQWYKIERYEGFTALVKAECPPYGKNVVNFSMG